MRRPAVKSLSLLRLIACILVLSLVDQTAAICENATPANDVTISIISPKDSSLWVGTASKGLLRIGATGRSFTYSTLTGHLECDSIIALAFDENGLLWIRDARDVVLTYSTLEGFVQRSDIPASVREALFETTAPEPEEPVVDEPKKPATWPWVLVIVCLIAVICALVYFILRRRNASTPSAAKPEIRPEPQPEAKPEPQTQLAVKPETKLEPQPKSQPQPEVKPGAVAHPGTLFEVQDFEAKVREIVEKNYTDKDFSVDQIAAELGISRVHLSRKLKALSASSPSDMIKARRMEAAATMLRSGEKNMATVAAACGFASPAYFSSAFKAFYGVSPSVFE
ncbi:MAG: helix-turn-helix domain-containing protein [Bacteroidales bacterium]|nr:helix-turn-helix domain-containing protein [Bacteroidales bacterium]